MQANGVSSPAVETVRRIAREVAGPAADDVDRKGRFPSEAVVALKEARMMGALVPREQGGLGCSILEVAEMCEALAEHCGAAGVAFAMHHIQLQSILRHAMDLPYYQAYIAELCEKQYVIGSATSEAGIGGEIRTSRCALVRDGTGHFKLDKDCSTVSYGEQADDILLQARRSPDATPNDQVFVLVRKKDYTLTLKGTWDALGMRGTCSPPYFLESRGEVGQIFNVPFSEVANETQVPCTHVFWTNAWLGMATGAVKRAHAFVRQQARTKPGTLPASALRLAEVSNMLQTMRASVHDASAEYQALLADPDGKKTLSSIGYALKANNLKVSSAQMVAQIALHALQICGIMGYKNDTKYSVGRYLRDALSASLQVGNDRMYATNASMLLVLKDD